MATVITHGLSGSSASLECAVAAEPDHGANRHGDPLFMTSLARGLLVIRAFTGLRRERTIASISRITGLSRAAVRRCLYTLCVLGYARRDGRIYRLLPKALALGHGALLPTDRVSVPLGHPSRTGSTPQKACRGG